MSEKSEQPEVLWSHCNECGQETKHAVLHNSSKSRCFDDGSYSVEFGTNWKLLQCRGCEDVSLRRRDWCSEDFPGDSPSYIFFPPRVSRKKPDWLHRDEDEIPMEYQELLNEVYTALYADSRRLAMMGARALIDRAIQRNVGDQGNFVKGLDALESNSLIGGQEREIIEAAVNVGNASAHRGHAPKEDEARVVMDIVERLIHTEILAQQAQKLKEKMPKRERSAERE